MLNPMRLFARTRRLPPDEQAFVDRIEAERAALERSEEELQYLDFGAGRTGDDGKSKEEMERGTLVTRRVGEVCRVASKPPRSARILFDLVRERRPETCIELGTCLGISAAYAAAALELNGGGFLFTLEGAAPLAERARSLLERLGLSHRVEVRAGRFVDLLPALLAEHDFDYAFVDGHHDEQATLHYFAAIRPRMRPGGVFVFDDVDWSDGMRRAWHAIRTDDRVDESWKRKGMGFAAVGGTSP
jgi:predicted O-methyltransferase YrrM